MADTDIELKVALDSRDVTTRANALQKEIQNIFSKTSDKPLSKSMQSTMNQMSRLSGQADKLKHKLDELGNKQIPTDQYKALDKEIQKLEKDLAKAADRLDELSHKEGVKPDKLQDARNEVRGLTEQLEDARDDMAKLEESGEAFTSGMDTDAYGQIEEQLKNVDNSMAGTITRFYEMDSAADSVGTKIRKAFELGPIIGAGSAIGKIGGLFESAGQKVNEFGKALQVAHPIAGTLVRAFSALPTVVGKTIGLAGKAITKLGELVNKVAKTIGSKLVGAFQKLGSSIKDKFVNALHGGNKAAGGLAGSMKNLIGAMLGFRGIYSVIQKVMGAIKEGINNLAQWRNGNNATNASLSMLMSSLTQLKNALGAAFSPILTAIAPALNTLIQLCVSAANAIARLFAALGGASKVVQAKKVTQDYAKTLDKTGGSAGKAAKEMKNFTGSYDELNVIEKENDSGGGGGGAGGGALSPEDMFEEVEIDPEIQELVDKLKEAWKNADFTEIGNIIGEKLKDALKKAEDWLVDVGQPLAAKVGKSLATFFNGLFETEGLGEQLGRTIGEGINTALEFANTFLDETHFDSIGKFIGDALNGLTIAINWEGIGDLFSSSLNALFDTLGGIAEEWDASATGEGIASAINKAISEFNWAKNMQSLSDFILDLLDLLIKVVEDTHWDELGEGIATSINNIKWREILTRIGTLGADVINGLFDLLLNAIDETDWEEIGRSIIDGIATFFDTFEWSNIGHGISSVWTALFTFLSGLLEEVEWTELAGNIIDSIAEAVGGMDVDSMANSFFEFLGAAIGALAGLVVGLGTKIAEVCLAIKDSFVAWFEENAFNDLGEFTIEGFLQGILDALTNIGTWIVENVFNPFINGFKDAFGIASPSKVMEEQGNFIVDGLVNAIKEMPGKVIAFFTQLRDDIKFKIGEIVNNAKLKFEKMRDNVVSAVKDLKTKVVNFFKALWEGSDGQGGVKGIVDKAKKGVTDAWDTIKTNVETTVKDLKDNVVGFFKSLWEGADGKGGVKGFVDDAKKGITDAWDTIKTTVESTVKNLKDNVIGFFGDIWTGIKGAINSILGGIQKMCNGIIGGVNTLFGMLNKVSIDIPEGVPGIGGKHIGFNLTPLSEVKINPLAEGGVIPPNAPFLAMLGDQKQGTNIEAPLSTIQEAVANVLEPYLAQIADNTAKTAEKDLTVRIGDRDIARSATRGQKMMGLQIRTS